MKWASGLTCTRTRQGPPGGRRTTSIRPDRLCIATEMAPDLPFLLHHPPTLFKTVIPVDAFKELTKSPNIVGMKDSHRDTRATA